MKRFFSLLLMILGMVVLLPLSLSAQVDEPTGIADAITNIDIYMGTLLGIALLSNFITSFVLGIFSKLPTWSKRLVSWLVPITLCVVLGYWLNIGLLAEQSIYIAILYGAGAGLVSNGIFDIEVVNTLVKAIQNTISNYLKKE